MEKELSIEEKIRKAESISQRRNGGNTVYSIKENKEHKSDLKLFKKMVLQVLICLIIYFIFYLIQTTNYVFSASTITKTREILNYDVNFEEIYSNIKSSFKVDDTEETTKETADENTEETNTSNTIETIEESASDKNIQSSEEYEEINEITTTKEETEQINNEEENENKEEYASIADEINNKYLLIRPVSGPVSSEFGTREPEGDIVTPYHHGIDIAVVTGTRVECAMNGKVILSANSDSYGKYIKVQDGDLITVYAHCSELLKNEGDEVGRGEVIALSGATGKVTGPHLHFEIIYKGEYVNPRDVLEF